MQNPGVGDLVRITPEVDCAELWPECVGQIGTIVELAKRVYIPAAKVLVIGEVAEFDLDELEVISESR